MNAIQIVIAALLTGIFYMLVIWFLHKASMLFHKKDAMIGNTDTKRIHILYNKYGTNKIELPIAAGLNRQATKQRAYEQVMISGEEQIFWKS